jgi:orotate phosphoribosyltransferase
VKETLALDLVKTAGAVLSDTHVVYTSGRHGSTYLNKDALYPRTELISRFCLELAGFFSNDDIAVVVGPALGGIVLSQWTAHHLGMLTKKTVLAAFAEKTSGGFELRRGYGALVADQRTLIVEDVLTTGGSLKAVVEAARSKGAEVMGAAVLCNRGGVTKEMLAISKLCSLVNLRLDSWEAADCPLCRKRVPINREVGKG